MACSAAYEPWLAPAAEDEFDKQIRGLMTSGAALGRIEKLDDDARRIATKVYRTTLAHLPLDLLSEGVKAAVTNWRYPGLPEPAAIIEPIQDELARRQNEARRVATALEQLRKQKQAVDTARVTPDQIAALKEKYPGAFGLAPEMPLYPEERMSDATKDRIRAERKGEEDAA